MWYENRKAAKHEHNVSCIFAGVPPRSCTIISKKRCTKNSVRTVLPSGMKTLLVAGRWAVAAHEGDLAGK